MAKIKFAKHTRFYTASFKEGTDQFGSFKEIKKERVNKPLEIGSAKEPKNTHIKKVGWDMTHEDDDSNPLKKWFSSKFI